MDRLARQCLVASLVAFGAAAFAVVQFWYYLTYPPEGFYSCMVIRAPHVSFLDALVTAQHRLVVAASLGIGLASAAVAAWPTRFRVRLGICVASLATIALLVRVAWVASAMRLRWSVWYRQEGGGQNVLSYFDFGIPALVLLVGCAVLAVVHGAQLYRAWGAGRQPN